MLHKLTIIGRVGKDAATKYTPGGKQVTNFSVAVDQGKDQPARWYDVALWGDVNGNFTQHIRKGATVYCEGRDNPRVYSKDGEARLAHGLDMQGSFGCKIIQFAKDQQADGPAPGVAFNDFDNSEYDAPLPPLSHGD